MKEGTQGQRQARVKVAGFRKLERTGKEVGKVGKKEARKEKGC